MSDEKRSLDGKSSDRPGRDLSGLSRWAPELAEAFVSLSSDIALVIGDGGVIEKVVQSRQNPIAAAAREWVGKSFADTVTGDTRAKIENLLKEVSSTGLGRRREVNHPTSGDSLPVAYTAIRLGLDGPLLAVGRDLRTVAAIQQRFLDAQRDTEQAYWRDRQADSRYQLLFQVATDAMMVVDGESRLIVEVNEAASALLAVPAEELLGKPATFAFDEHSRNALGELMDSVSAGGRQREVRARLSGMVVFTSVAATPLRVQGTLRFLLRVRTVHKTEPAQPLTETLAKLVDDASEAVVVADSNGRILVANRASLGLLGTADEDQVRGQLLGERLTVPSSIPALIEQVRSQGMIGRVDATLKSAKPGRVRLSATLLNEGDQELIGFRLRRLALAEPEVSKLPALEDLAGLLGTKALPQLMNDASGLVERYFIAKAEELCGGDAVACARLLGLEPGELARRKRAIAPPVDPEP